MTEKSVTLPDDLAADLEARVAGGAGDDVAGVVRSALRALDAEDARRLEAIRQKISRSIADPRPPVPADEAFDRIEAMLAALDKA